jgi:hypothetical protein
VEAELEQMQVVEQPAEQILAVVAVEMVALVDLEW